MSRKTGPPPRPPAPRVGSGGGISLSFKALEEEDDEELTVVTGKFDKQVHDVRERQLREHERERSHSKSPDISHFGTEKPTIKSQNSLDKLIDIKEKIQDTISKKIEELSSESPAKTDRETTLEHRNSEELEDSGLAGLKEDEENGHGFEKDLDIDNDYFVDPAVEYNNPNSNGVDDIGENGFEIDEEYYNPDAEDFSELPGVVSPVRQRKRFQKFRKIKPVIPPSPVTMSKLNHNIPEDRAVDKEGYKDTASEKPDTVTHSKAQEASIEFHGTVIPVKKIAGCAIIFLLYLLIPLPSYVSGMIVGIILSSSGWMLYLWVTKPPKPREPIPEDPPLDKLPPLPLPELREPKGEDCSYKGWMNEITEYTPDSYSINQTHSVYVHLDGASLRLRRPKVGVPKRAMWDEPTQSPQFVHQRHFDLEDSKVLLIPLGLVKKRLWSKKYPICVALAKDGKKHSVKHDSLTAASRAGNQSPGRMSTSSSIDSVQGFELVNEQKCDTSVLYLFARTCHEKEQWFKRLECAAKGIPLKNHILEIHRILSTSVRHRRSSSTDSLKQKRQESSDSLSSLGTNSPTVEEAPTPENDLRDFVMYMSRLVPRDKDSLPSSPAHTSKDMKTGESKLTFSSVPRGIICDPVLLPLNALLGRCFWDFLRDQYWQEKVKDKLQKKLSKIHIPYFIEELKISDIDLGTEVPVIRRANRPYLDENGFWVDLDVTYSGKFKMTIETKVNLLRLKQTVKSKNSADKENKKKSAVTDSDEEDSAESSTDEEEEPIGEDGMPQQGGTGKKFMKYINKITASKYFQSATENKYIKKAMTEVSNTRLILTVEVQKLNGTLAINIPAPPTDRLWYGFRGNPQLWLVAKPKVGEREVTMSHITEWIEKKLASEFQLVLVMPNMDDLVIPILLPGETVSETTAAPDTPTGSSEV